MRVRGVLGDIERVRDACSVSAMSPFVQIPVGEHPQLDDDEGEDELLPAPPDRLESITSSRLWWSVDGIKNLIQPSTIDLVPAPAAPSAAPDYGSIVLKIDSLMSHVRGEHILSNLKYFEMNVSVMARKSGSDTPIPYTKDKVSVALVTEDGLPLIRLLSDEDRQFVQLVGPDGVELREAGPVDVQPDGQVFFRLRLGKRMISSNFGKRLRLLVFLNVEQETLQEFPNLSVVSPPFVAKTRLRNPKPEKKEKEAGSSTWRSPLPVLPTGTPTTGSSRPGVVHDPVTYQVSALVQRLVALEKRVRELEQQRQPEDRPAKQAKSETWATASA